MAKNTAQGAQESEALVFEAIVSIFMESGWESVSYGAISQKTGLTRGGIQRIVPNKQSMVQAFRGQVFQFVVSQLNLKNDETIRQSWLASLNDRKFANCIKYLITAVNAKPEGKKMAFMGLERLIEVIGEGNTMYVLGASVHRLLSSD